MKNLVAVVIIIAWSILFIFPSSGSANEDSSDRILKGAAIGAAIGAVVGIVIYLATPKEGGQAKNEKKDRLTQSSNENMGVYPSLDFKEDSKGNRKSMNRHFPDLTLKVSF